MRWPDYPSPRAEMREVRGLSLCDPHRLGVHELADADCSQLAAVAGLLHAPERNARVGGDHLIDKNHSRLEFVDEALAFFVVVGPGAGAQTETNIICDADGFILIFRAKD